MDFAPWPDPTWEIRPPWVRSMREHVVDALTHEHML